MSQELVVEGKTYISSKRASQISGYAQDYIGQLARKQLIDARRIGGLWYIFLDSLQQYQKEAEAYKPQPPVFRPDLNAAPDTVISLDGKDYVSAAKAATVTGYHQDYVGQLARSGSILSKQIGNRWYVDKVGIVAHKRDKDSLLAAVQSNSVGIAKQGIRAPEALPTQENEPELRYFSEEGDLMPEIGAKAEEIGLYKRLRDNVEVIEDEGPTPVPIRRIPHTRETFRDRGPKAKKHSLRVPFLAAGALATIVIVLTVGYTSIKSGSTYTIGDRLRNTAASFEAAKSLEYIADMIEQHFIPTIKYQRQ
jgi:hypothetical protein